MAGVILMGLLWVLAGWAVGARLNKAAKHLDPAEIWGLGALLGMGGVGTLVFLVGHLGGVAFAPYIAVVLLVGGVVTVLHQRPAYSITRPQGMALMAMLLATILFFLTLLGVLAPTTEWDSLAYHLAVPKLWISEGRIAPIPFIHHSYFPFAADSLYLIGWPLGESGAKAHMLWGTVAGAVALFGLLRRMASESAAWLGVLLWIGAPVVAWEAGTAYIDGLHGAWAGLGLVYLLLQFFAKEEDRAPWWVGAVLLGLGLASKYTGLQVALAGAAVALVAATRQKRFKEFLLIGAVAFAFAAPVFLRNAALTGNPVFPFFYSAFGGRGWDQWRADIYANEQASFGVGKQSTALGHATLGLAYQPGRYTNPRQTEGGGFPTGAVGFAIILLAVAAWASGRTEKPGRAALAAVAILMLGWFALSQQSRYLAFLIPPIALAAAPILRDRKWQPVLAAALFGQAIYTLGMIWNLQGQDQLRVAAGQISPTEYRQAFVPFAADAATLNQLPADSKIALYDEVFGFLLDRDYMWANPGHSMLINHENAQTGPEYRESLRANQVTHVYVALRFWAREDRERWLQAAGLIEGGMPYSAEESAAMNANLDLKWRRLLADSLRSGDLKLVGQFRSALLLEVPSS